MPESKLLRWSQRLSQGFLGVGVACLLLLALALVSPLVPDSAIPPLLSGLFVAAGGGAIGLLVCIAGVIRGERGGILAAVLWSLTTAIPGLFFFLAGAAVLSAFE